MDLQELKDFERITRKLDCKETYKPNTYICLRCGYSYDSGCSGTYSFTANFCGICLIEAQNEKQ